MSNFKPGGHYAIVTNLCEIYGLIRTQNKANPDGLFTGSDPFNGGSPGDWEMARWMRSLYDLAGGEAYTGYLRDLHYLVNAKHPEIYDASGKSWEKMMTAKGHAVTLGLIAPDALADQVTVKRSVNHDKPTLEPGMDHIFVPEAGELEDPQISDVNPATALPFDLMLWVEKGSPSVEAEVDPVLVKYGMDHYRGKGMPGSSFVGLRAAEATQEGRELVIVVLSDADASGSVMARAIAKNAEMIVRAGLIEGATRTRVVKVDFTMAKVDEIEKSLGREIPRTVDGKTGEERVELQALPAFVPGELGKLIEEAVVSVVGETFVDDLEQWEDDLDQALQDSDAASDLATLHGEYEAYLASDEGIAAVEAIQGFEDRRDEIHTEMRKIVNEFEPMEIIEPGTDWLLDTDREFLDQIQAYRRHEGRDPIDLTPRKCALCGNEFVGNIRRRYCSNACRGRATRLASGHRSGKVVAGSPRGTLA